MLISPEYRELNRNQIVNNKNYAVSGHLSRDAIRKLSDWGRKPILDYGCGRALLAQSLGPAYKVTNYDPCVPEYDIDPQPHPAVFCGDVLEHIEPDLLHNVLGHLRSLVSGVGLFRICVVPSSTTLDDGRNAHLIVQPHEWWRERLVEAGFEITEEKEPKEVKGLTWFVVK